MENNIIFPLLWDKGLTMPVSLQKWIDEIISLCTPANVEMYNGTKEAYEKICQRLVSKGQFIPLNPEIRPGSFASFSDPGDVARTEQRTFICCNKEDDAGPTNNWVDPPVMKEKLMRLMSGCMKGRTMYIIPFCMGPVDSSFSKLGVEVTDSEYVVANMHLMTRTGRPVMEKFLQQSAFVRCFHSVGVPLEVDQVDSRWPCNTQEKYIAHFPEEQTIISYGSGYGGNALLGKKSFSLRIASVMARNEGWLAEHMLILGIENPEGEKIYVAAAFPSACGKTNLAMLLPPKEFKGWKITTVGDDIAWLYERNGKLFAINPEKGFFGVAPGTGVKTNPAIMQTIKENTIFTNTGFTPSGDVWWEGLSEAPPQGTINWKREKYDGSGQEKVAHPNARFTVSIDQCPSIDEDFNNIHGVPISAFIFGGRRSSTIPLVYQAFNWDHGVYLAATMGSETTAAAEGSTGSVRFDPFAMSPFCGYHIADYFAHWLRFGRSVQHPPAIFSVNWFRKNESGDYYWPGFSENFRVIQWIYERVKGKADAIERLIGWMPAYENMDWRGLDFSKSLFDKLTDVCREEWLKELKHHEVLFRSIGAKLPTELELIRLLMISAVERGTEKK